MIDSLTSLAFSIHSGRGIYALLIGSGVSRAAQIPTGWEIILDLIRKAAAVRGVDCEPDPAAWYFKQFEKEPDYSDLLATMALSAAERTNALRGYFEASPLEIQEGKKQPTTAHRVIARLVRRGYFRVIVTTNFDRLLEQALVGEGVDPVVISTPDMVSGAVPLAHSACTIIKVHGDYRDTRLKNTVEELAVYSPKINRLLDRVFDEYGLVVCGWSATWDKALRAAILRASNRRYSAFWTVRGALSSESEELVKFRAASVIPIDSADKFFQSLGDKLEALERLDSPHPLSAAMAVASVKRFLVDDRFRIELHDLIMDEVERRLSGWSQLPVSTNNVDCEFLLGRLFGYEEGMKVLLSILATGCFWGSVTNARLWSKAIVRLLDLAAPANGTVALLNLRRYPCLIALYAAGIACVAVEDYSSLKVLLRDARTSVDLPYDGNDALLIRKIPIGRVLSSDLLNTCIHEQRTTPVSDRLHTQLRETFRSLIPSDKAYDELFDRWEYLLALVGYDSRLEKAGSFLPIVGRFGWRYEIDIADVLSKEHMKLGDQWPPLAGGLFGSSERFLQAEKGYREDVLARFPRF